MNSASYLPRVRFRRSFLCAGLLAAGIGNATLAPVQATSTFQVAASKSVPFGARLQFTPAIALVPGSHRMPQLSSETLRRRSTLAPQPLLPRSNDVAPKSRRPVSKDAAKLQPSLVTSDVPFPALKPSVPVATSNVLLAQAAPLQNPVAPVPEPSPLVSSTPEPTPLVSSTNETTPTVSSTNTITPTPSSTNATAPTPSSTNATTPTVSSTNETATPTANAPVAASQPLVTNSFADTDLKQALADVTAQTGVSIIADNTVQGTVTLDLKDVPLERALMMLLQSGGFAFAKMDGYYLVGAPEPTNPNFYLFSRTEIVQLKNVRPEVILSLLSVPYGRYLSSEGATPIVTARGSSSDEGRRSVSGGFGGGFNNSSRNGGSDADIGRPAPTYKVAITAPTSMIARIKADIAQLDQQRRQVMLEAQVLEISQDDLKNLGFNFATRFLQFSTTGMGNNLGNGGNFAYSSVSNSELIQIAALAQKGAVKVRATPRVATGDGQTAEMEVGRESYFSIVSGANNFAYNTLEVIRSGISLRITPRILEDTGEVQALVEPEVRDVTGSGANGLPEITFRRAATNVRVRDGESIVIGGLINEFDSKTNSKIPVLGNLPVVGGLFRGTNTRRLRTETVIIVTPRILHDELVRDGIQSPALNRDVQDYRDANRVVPLPFQPQAPVPATP